MSRNVMITAPRSPVSAAAARSQRKQRQAAPLSMPNTKVLGRRLTAFVLDGALTTALQALLTLGVWHSVVGVPDGSGGYFQFSLTRQLNWPWTLLLLFAYFFLFEVVFGATPGKLLMGLRVVTRNGERPALWQLVVRSAIRLVELAPGVFSFAWIGAVFCVWVTARHQRIGDLLARTVVADVSSLSRPVSTRVQRIRRAALALAIGEALALLCLAFSFYIQPALTINNWLRGQQPDFLPKASQVLSASNPTYGHDAQGEATLTYRLTVMGPSNNGYSSEEMLDQHYSFIITYRWSNLLVGWEIDPASIKILPPTIQG